MKIVKLLAENVKRLHAVEITPDGALITIGGKNGAGKSSVLDSIAYAMGGEKLVPAEPIRAGEAEAKIVVDLGDLIVTRRFRRPVLDTRTLGMTDEEYAAQPKTFGETMSTLVVTNKDGAKYPSPQAVLDKLLGRLTFDPLAFARDEPRRQDEVLRKLVGLDVSAIEARRRAAFDQRAMLKKTHTIREAQLASLPHHEGVPEAEIPLNTNRLREAEELRRLAEEAEREVEQGRFRKADRVRLLAEQRATLAELQKQVTAIEGHIASGEAQLADVDQDIDARQITAQAARAVVPDMAVISAEMAAAEATNARVRANLRRGEAQAALDGIAQDLAAQHDLVAAAEQEKADALAAAQFPVPGLGLGDDGVTFNGLPFAQAGSAEQVRVSVAIGIALNPKLQVLLIRNGNLLDDDSLAAVAAQAEAAGMQVWMEYVTADAGEVAVMLEDGHVA